jgi:hypothetical protein
MLLPMIITVIIGYLQDLSDQPNAEQPTMRILAEWVVWTALYGIISALFAVVIHRSILLDERVSSSRWFLRLTKRETIFTGWSLLIGGGMWFMAATGVALTGALAVPFNIWCSDLFDLIGKAHPWLENLGQTLLIGVGVSVIGFLVSYFAARTSLLLPATALDQRQKLGWAWTVSKPHAIRLAFLVGAIPLASLTLQTLGGAWISELLWDPVLQVLSAFVYCSLLIMEITILSLSYRWIVESMPTTHSPAIVEQIP